ncbi:MAG TPA: YIP1 family protein [Candidatus Binatia bacterium]
MTDNEFIPQEGAKGFLTVWKRIITDPQGFYAEMPAGGGFDKPLIFLGVCAAVYLVLRILVADTMILATVSFFLVVLAYVLGPGILMLVAQTLFQGDGDYEGTVRVCAYAGACLVLAWLPYLGVLAFVYAFYLIFLGTGKIHNLDPTKATLTVLVSVPVTWLVLMFVLGKRVLQYIF